MDNTHQIVAVSAFALGFGLGSLATSAQLAYQTARNLDKGANLFAGISTLFEKILEHQQAEREAIA